MSLKLRLILSTVLLVLISIIVAGIISVTVAVSQSTDALSNSAEDKLVSQNKQVAEAISDYFGFIESQARTLSNSQTVKEASQEFTAAYSRYASQRGQVSSADMASLRGYYTEQFANRYSELNPKPIDNPASLLQGLNNDALALQHDFIAASPYPLGEKDKLVDLGNGTDYAKVHQKYHSELRDLLNEFDYYDIFIVDAASGNLVYSVFKELDYATNLSAGPYAATGIGKAFKLALGAKEANQVFFTSIEPYLPSYSANAGFISSPIFVNGRLQAVLIFQMPMDHINDIMTHEQKWSDQGLGESGETYLVDTNSLLLTESRFFLEDANGYFAAIGKKYPDVAKQAKLRGTSVGIQPVRSESARQVLRGQSGFKTVEDYRGVEVFSAYTPVQLGEHTLGVIAEIDVEESLRPAGKLRNGLIQSTIVLTILLIAGAAAVALYLANMLVKPLNRMGTACKELTTGEGDLTIQLKTVNIPEIDNISTSFNVFIRQIREIVSQVKTNADSLSAASQELSAITSQSETVTGQQRDQTAMVASAMEELSASINEIAHSTTNTSERSLEAQASLKENMERANMAAENIKLLVQLINDSSVVISSLKNEVNQITTVLGVITSIADQTNLLALNAAIEAARAGEAGRGFSVVADEVRALATRSQESTVEISKMVEVMNQSSQKSVERMERAAAAADGGIHLVDLVTTAMNELDANLKHVLQLTDTVAAATEEQNVTSDSVVENVHNINDMAREVSEGATQTSHAADELARIASDTHDLVSRFKV